MTYKKVSLLKVDESFFKIVCEPSLLRQISDHYKFEVPGAKFTPRFKMGGWDGAVSLMQPGGLLYAGLLKDIVTYLNEHINGVQLTLDPKLAMPPPVDQAKVDKFVASLNLPFKPHAHQLDALYRCINRRRCGSLLPTSAGKSLTIYMLARWYDKKTKLIIVPSTGLIHQIAQDFVDYGCDPSLIQKVHGKEDRKIHGEIVIATWQTLIRLDPSWFKKIDVMICDEAHNAKGKSLVKIISEWLRHVADRFAFTGTTDGSELTLKTLTGLFGPFKQHIMTSELMDQGKVAQLKVNMLILKYPPDEAQTLYDEEGKSLGYANEMNFLMRHERRNKFIVNLALAQKRNTMIVCDRIETHLDVLHAMIAEKIEPGRRLIYISGDVEGEERDQIRKEIEQEQNCIVCVSRRAFGTGSNTKNLHSIILASPLKALVANLQVIGRGLRLHSYKDACILHDIADDLRWSGSENSTYRHFRVRRNTYRDQNFNLKEFKLPI